MKAFTSVTKKALAAPQGERQADPLPEAPHEAGPQESQLEREDRAGDRAHREEHRRAFGQFVAEESVVPVSRTPVQEIRDDH
jgi:hypothetical protein